MKKPYITLEEALAAREEGRRSVKFLTEDNGCINGCCSGVTICSETEFNPEPGFHWKEMDLSGLTTKSLRLKRVIHS